MTLLRFIPPETAHRAVIWALQKGLGPALRQDDPRLETKLFGKTLRNPVGLAAGADKNAEALEGWARVGFGFVEAGTVTPRARTGNPLPRIWRMGNGHLVNWMGLPGLGLDAAVANLKRYQHHPGREALAVGVSLAAPDDGPDAFRALSAACAPLADYLTLNASCPNVAGHTDNPAREASAQMKAVVAEAGGKPVLLKLGPTRDAEILKVMVNAAMEAGAAGFVATNTVPSDKAELLGKKPPFNWPKHDGKPVGGYSGPLLLDTACWMVSEIRALAGADAPVIGGGGIQSGKDALRAMQAGANAIQLYTGLIYGGLPLIDQIKLALMLKKA